MYGSIALYSSMYCPHIEFLYCQYTVNFNSFHHDLKYYEMILFRLNDMYFYFKCIPCVTGLWVDVVAWFGLLIGILIPTAFKSPCCTSGFVATALIPVEINPASGSLFGWLLLLLLAWLRVPSKSPRLMRTENIGHFEFHSD